MVRVKKDQILSQPVKVLDSIASADLVPAEGSVWKHLLPRIHRVSQRFGFHRIETSPLESAGCYPRGLVNSESGIFLEAFSSKKFGLKSQNFLSILRAYAENRIFEREKVTKWYCIEPSFTVDKNVLSPLYEFGLVNFGDPGPISEAHLIVSIKSLLEELGLHHPMFEINHKGCDICTPYYREVLARFLQDNQSALCDSCQEITTASCGGREAARTDMEAVFACPNRVCQEILNTAPQILDYLDGSCNKQLTALLESLDELEVSYQLNPRLFGNSWLSCVVFRVNVSSSASEGEGVTPLSIGGRYTKLASKMIGQDMPALAFFVPLHTVAQMVEAQGDAEKPEKMADIFLINLGELAAKKSLRLFTELWKNNISVTEHFGENGIKNQFKLAEKKGCSLALLIGQKEALEGSVILRDIRSGIQEVFSYDRIIEEIRKRLQD